MGFVLVKGNSAKFGRHGKLGELDIPNIEFLKNGEMANIFDFKVNPRWACALERWQPAVGDWEYAYDEILYIIYGGPIKVAYEGETYEALPGDFLSFTKGTKVHFEMVNFVIFLTIFYPDLNTLYKELSAKFPKKK